MSAQFLQSVGGKLLSMASPETGGEHWNFGLIESERRSLERKAFDAAFLAQLPDFKISGSWAPKERVALWKVGAQLFGRHLRYNWQTTGSCVGAGGDNALKTVMAVEIVMGDFEEFRTLWWPYTYGRSRFRMGDRGPGEGSTGETWGEAILEDGSIAIEEAGNVPAFTEERGWIKLSRATELSWSDGDAPQTLALMPVAKQHIVKTMAKANSHADVLAGLDNGYTATQASNFGFRQMVPTPRGNPAVRMVSWDGSWSHQTYIDEYWNHPTEGLIFRWGNNWGPDAHGPALADEPDSSVYITAATLDKICQRGTVLILSPYNGYPARKVPVDWTP